VDLRLRLLDDDLAGADLLLAGLRLLARLLLARLRLLAGLLLARLRLLAGLLLAQGDPLILVDFLVRGALLELLQALRLGVQHVPVALSRQLAHRCEHLPIALHPDHRLGLPALVTDHALDRAELLALLRLDLLVAQLGNLDLSLLPGLPLLFLLLCLLLPFLLLSLCGRLLRRRAAGERCSDRDGNDVVQWTHCAAPAVRWWKEAELRRGFRRDTPRADRSFRHRSRDDWQVVCRPA
jgi:hypothetical protein